MKPSNTAVTVLLLAAASIPLHAQTSVTVRAAGFYESYGFDTDVGSLPLKSIYELSVPVGIDVSFADIADLTVSSGYANVDLTSKDPATLSDQQTTGILDTEARLSVNVIPNRLLLLVNGTIPTGTNTVAEDELAVAVSVVPAATARPPRSGAASSGHSAARGEPIQRRSVIRSPMTRPALPSEIHQR